MIKSITRILSAIAFIGLAIYGELILYPQIERNRKGEIFEQGLTDHHVSTETYDFEMREGEPLRNIATKIGEVVAGEGTTYYINYEGTIPIPPQPTPVAPAYNH